MSESQEGMVMSVPPQNIEKLLKIFADENVEAVVLGEFDGSGRLQLFFHGQQVADLDMAFIHDGLPQITKEAVYHKPVLKQEELSKKAAQDLTENLCAALSHYNVA